MQKSEKSKQQKQKPESIQQLQTYVKQAKLADKNYTKEQAMSDFKEKKGKYSSANNFVQQHRNTQKQYDQLLGRKIYEEVVAKLGSNYQALSSKDHKVLELLLIEDDFIDSLKSVVSKVSSTVAPYIKPAVKLFAPQFSSLVDQIMPSTVQQQGESIRIQRRWQLADVKQPTTDIVNVIEVNPGLRKFGQWLSLISRAYQYYRINSLEISYIPSTALTTQGNIMYYIEMDNNAPSPSIHELPQQYKSSVHALYTAGSVRYTSEELHQTLKRMHCRNELVTDYEVDQYDVGRFFYACSNASSLSYGQFYADIDISFYIPTLQNLSTDWVMQAQQSGMSYTTFKFPDNDVVSYDSSLLRTINSTTCNGYRVTSTGILRFGVFATGGNTNAVSRAIPCVANNTTDTPTNGTIVSQYYVTTAGAQYDYYAGQLAVKAGQLLWIAPNGTGEKMSNFTLIGLGYSPNFFPWTAQLYKRPTQEQEDIQVLQGQLKFIQELLNKSKTETRTPSVNKMIQQKPRNQCNLSSDEIVFE